jgi:hypothetical protein
VISFSTITAERTVTSRLASSSRRKGRLGEMAREAADTSLEAQPHHLRLVEEADPSGEAVCSCGSPEQRGEEAAVGFNELGIHSRRADFSR